VNTFTRLFELSARATCSVTIPPSPDLRVTCNLALFSLFARNNRDGAFAASSVFNINPASPSDPIS